VQRICGDAGFENRSALAVSAPLSYRIRKSWALEFCAEK
jgi:hypothetical protein